MKQETKEKAQQAVYGLIRESWPLIRDMIGEPTDEAYMSAFHKACEWQNKMVLTPREYSTLTAMEQAQYQFSMLLVEMMEVCDRINKTIQKQEGENVVLRGCAYAESI